jgi:hypothetical protein
LELFFLLAAQCLKLHGQVHGNDPIFKRPCLALQQARGFRVSYFVTIKFNDFWGLGRSAQREHPSPLTIIGLFATKNSIDFKAF